MGARTLIVLAWLLSIGGAHAARASRAVALLPLEDRARMTAAERGQLDAALRRAARRLPAGQFRLLSPEHVARARKAGPCTRVCALGAGKALGADYVLVGWVDRAPEGRAAIISLYHVNSNGHLGTRRAAGKAAQLPSVIEVAGGHLFDLLQPGRRPAPVVARPAPPRATPQRPAARPTPRRATPRPARRPAQPAGVAAATRPAPTRLKASARPQPAPPNTRRDPGWFELWMAGKADSIGGQADVFGKYNRAFGPGIELGVEMLGIDVWGEALFMGNGEYFFSLGLGFDMEFGGDVSVLLGVYTGPMFMLFPKEPVETFTLTPDQRRLLQASGIDAGTLNSLEKGYNDATQEEADLNRLAVGWNVVRMRMALDYWVAPVLALGAHATGGYHYLLSGEDLGANIKYTAIQDVRKDQGLTDQQAELLRQAVGAKKVEVDSLGGFNVTGGIYLKLSI